MKYFVILICCLFSSCSLLETDGGDKDWWWTVNIVDQKGNDLFYNYDAYIIDSLSWKTRGLPNDSLTGMFRYNYIINDDEREVDIFSVLETGFTFRTTNGTESSYYLYYANGDIDTILVTVEGPGEDPSWSNEKWKDIDILRYYFNGELAYEFNIKENPSLEDEIKKVGSETNNLVFVKKQILE